MHSFQSGAPPRHRQAGFSLVEIMIVVVIISLLAMLALPAIQKVRRSAQTNRFVSDLRVFAQAFEGFSMQTGGWPASAGSGVIPTGMGPELRHDLWSTVNSLGGRWNWDNTATGIGIAITDVTAPTSQLVEIDARIDDGDLSNGLFQFTGTRYVYFLQR
jgi:prepilin-type N-terminal cleavage/methylation domain-containing protein